MKKGIFYAVKILLFYYFIILLFLFNSFQVFSVERCRKTFHPLSESERIITFSKSVGVESYNEALVRELKFILGREPNLKQIEAVEKANLSGKGQMDIARIREKRRILKKAGFSKEEIHDLVKNRIIWVVSEWRPDKFLSKNLRKRNIEEKKLYFLNKEHNFEPRVGRINRILVEKDKEFLVEVDWLDPSSGALKQDSISISKNLRNIPFHPSIIQSKLKMLFEAVKPGKKVITLRDLNLPPPTTKEIELAKQGYRSAYTDGLDNLNEWAVVRRMLQELRANPYTTHIEYFEDQVKELILSI